jgi:hypothetical protein
LKAEAGATANAGAQRRVGRRMKVKCGWWSTAWRGRARFGAGDDESKRRLSSRCNAQLSMLYEGCFGGPGWAVPRAVLRWVYRPTQIRSSCALWRSFRAALPHSSSAHRGVDTTPVVAAPPLPRTLAPSAKAQSHLTEVALGESPARGRGDDHRSPCRKRIGGFERSLQQQLGELLVRVGEAQALVGPALSSSATA